MNRAIFIL